MKARHTLLYIAAALLPLPLTAQTLNVRTGSVVTAFSATGEEMPFTDGETLAIGGKTFNVADISRISVTSAPVADNTVSVDYDGTSALVTMAGNLAPYLTVTVSGAHVAIVQGDDTPEEITYTLRGTSTDGSFWMDGKLKASLVLDGLTLTCADSAAVNIRDGKRISVTLAEGTANTLTDGAGGSQKACFAVKGHTEFKGGGSLTLYGNAKHAFSSNEYVEFKKSAGTVTVKSAKNDGMNISQYLRMKGGKISISGVGDDGIQVDKTDNTDDEDNGKVIFSGGELDIATTAAGSKGLKCADSLLVSGGVITITTSGDATYADNDVSGCAAVKVNGTASISGGSLTLKSSGSGGKGLSGDADILVSGGTLDITTTGRQYSYGWNNTSSPKGIRADNNVVISGGDVTVTTSGGEGSEGIESKNELHIDGGNVVVNAYDDALNASSKISISGGKVYAYASNNDGIDSNGTLYISGGLVISNGTTQPEEGFDCDQNTFSVTGGTLIGIGGSTSTPTTSVTTQPVAIVSGQSLTQGQYLTLSDASGSAIWSFKCPRTINQATILFSSPSMSQGSSYTLASGATASGGTSWQGYSDDATVSGGSTLASVTLSSMVTNANGSGGGGGGGGRPGGGGGPGGGGRW